MGLSSLTRYNLFMESGDLIESGEGIVRFRDYLSVKNMYYDSARLLRGFEDIINNGERMPQMEEYQAMFDRNVKEVQNLVFVHRVTNQIQQQMSKKMEKEQSFSNLFKTYFKYLLKAIADYQEEVIETNFIEISDDESIRTARKKTFLSYAYYDKGLTQALFYYFWRRSGLRRYDIGSVAEIKGLNNEQYFILGLTYFDNELRAHVEKEDYIKAIASLVKYISERSQGFPTYMPVIGTGGADVGSANDLAVYIVKTIELFKDKIDCDIHIVVRDKEEKIGLMNLKML